MKQRPIQLEPCCILRELRKQQNN